MVEFVNKKPQANAKTPKVGGKGRDILSPTMDVDVDGSTTIDFLRSFTKLLLVLPE